MSGPTPGCEGVEVTGVVLVVLPRDDEEVIVLAHRDRLHDHPLADLGVAVLGEDVKDLDEAVHHPAQLALLDLVQVHPHHEAGPALRHQMTFPRGGGGPRGRLGLNRQRQAQPHFKNVSITWPLSEISKRSPRTGRGVGVDADPPRPPVDPQGQDHDPRLSGSRRSPRVPSPPPPTRTNPPYRPWSRCKPQTSPNLLPRPRPHRLRPSSRSR